MNRARLEHAMTTLSDGRILVTGGFGAGSAIAPLASAEIWDPSTQSFALTTPMNTPRGRHTATLLADGRVLVVGGFDGGTESSSAEVYDPATSQWTNTPGVMAAGRMYHAAVRLPSGAVLIASGAANAAYQTTEIWDPSTGLFVPSPPLHIAHASPTLTLLSNGRVLLVGNAALASAELYDEVTNTWVIAGKLDVPRNAHTATLLGDGRVLFVGGVTGLGSDVTTTETTEWYDPSSGAWTLGAPLAHRRSSHTATLAGDDVVIAGGLGAEASCERLSGEPCPPLNIPRTLHRALAVTLDGRAGVMVTGGDYTLGGLVPTHVVELLEL